MGPRARLYRAGRAAAGIPPRRGGSDSMEFNHAPRVFPISNCILHVEFRSGRSRGEARGRRRAWFPSAGWAAPLAARSVQPFPPVPDEIPEHVGAHVLRVGLVDPALVELGE